jgi:putative PIN family toxin of toxin-antitoxin system
VAEPSLPRLVLDTNVFVSGLISHAGAPARILAAIRKRKALHLVSDPIADEYLRVLSYPRIRKYRQVTDTFIADVATYILFKTERVELFSKIEVSPDPDDNVFLATALDGRADCVISGDKSDLLSLRAVENIPIITAGEAVIRFGM